MIFSLWCRVSRRISSVFFRIIENVRVLLSLQLTTIKTKVLNGLSFTPFYSSRIPLQYKNKTRIFILPNDTYRIRKELRSFGVKKFPLIFKLVMMQNTFLLVFVIIRMTLEDFNDLTGSTKSDRVLGVWNENVGNNCGVKPLDTWAHWGKDLESFHIYSSKS